MGFTTFPCRGCCSGVWPHPPLMPPHSYSPVKSGWIICANEGLGFPFSSRSDDVCVCFDHWRASAAHRHPPQGRCPPLACMYWTVLIWGSKNNFFCLCLSAKSSRNPVLKHFKWNWLENVGFLETTRRNKLANPTIVTVPSCDAPVYLKGPTPQCHETML